MKFILILVFLLAGAHCFGQTMYWRQVNGTPSGPLENIIELDGTWYASNIQYLYKSSDQGQTWSYITPAEGISPQISGMAAVNGKLIMSNYQNGVSTYIPATGVWQKAAATNADMNLASLLSLVRQGDRLWTNSMQGPLYYSTNSGNSWNKIIISPNITHVATGPHSFIVHDSVLAVVTPPAVFTSGDSGQSWTKYPVNFGNNFNGYDFLKTVVIGDLFFVGGGFNPLQVSSDLGKNWIRVASMPPVLIKDMAVFENRLFISTGSGVLMSTDRGASWQSVNAGINGGLSLASLTILMDRLYLSSTTGYTYVLETVAAAEENPEEALTIENTDNSIRIAVSRSPGNVLIELYDATGSLKRVLHSGETGECFKAEFSTEDLASGIYFIHLGMATRTFTKPVAVIH